jgi:hypothetical protein
MRTLIVIPVVVVLIAAGGYLTCGALGLNPHAREIIFAAVVCLIGSELAVVPLVLTRGAAQPTVAQAGLVGTMIHLFVIALLGGSLIVFKPVTLAPAVVYWLLGLYWLTLILLVIGFVRAVKAAPMGLPAAPKQA